MSEVWLTDGFDHRLIVEDAVPRLPADSGTGDAVEGIFARPAREYRA